MIKKFLKTNLEKHFYPINIPIGIALVLSMPHSTKILAEEWSCTYEHKGKTQELIRRRVGSYTFEDAEGIEDKIIKENEKFIHLYSNIEGFKFYFATHLDKENNKFSMVGLEPGKDTDIISGSCLISK